MASFQIKKKLKNANDMARKDRRKLEELTFMIQRKWGARCACLGSWEGLLVSEFDFDNDRLCHDF